MTSKNTRSVNKMELHKLDQSIFKYARWWVPILLMGLITPFTPWLDLSIARYFYQGSGEFVSNQFTAFIYEYGVIPGDLMIVLSLIALLLSYCSLRWKKWREPALLIILTMAIGAGIIVHGILKDHWGRPRPKQVVEFGGIQQFRPYYQPNFGNTPEPSKSFTCGHCTMGFCFVALAIAGRRLNNQTLYILGIILTIVMGSILSFVRMAQGGHFLSDVLGSALVMWLTAVTFDWLLFKKD